MFEDGLDAGHSSIEWSKQELHQSVSSAPRCCEVVSGSLEPGSYQLIPTALNPKHPPQGSSKQGSRGTADVCRLPYTRPLISWPPWRQSTYDLH